MPNLIDCKQHRCASFAQCYCDRSLLDNSSMFAPKFFDHVFAPPSVKPDLYRWLVNSTIRLHFIFFLFLYHTVSKYLWMSFVVVNKSILLCWSPLSSQSKTNDNFFVHSYSALNSVLISNWIFFLLFAFDVPHRLKSNFVEGCEMWMNFFFFFCKRNQNHICIYTWKEKK